MGKPCHVALWSGSAQTLSLTTWPALQLPASFSCSFSSVHENRPVNERLLPHLISCGLDATSCKHPFFLGCPVPGPLPFIPAEHRNCRLPKGSWILYQKWHIPVIPIVFVSSIAVKRHYKHCSSFKGNHLIGAGLQFQRFSSLSSGQGLWRHTADMVPEKELQVLHPDP